MKNRPYIVNEVISQNVRLGDGEGVLWAKSHLVPIGRVFAASRDEAVKTAGSQYPGRRITLTRENTNSQIQYTFDR